MAFSKIIAESMDLTDTYAFTGTVTGAGETNAPSFYAQAGSQTIPASTDTKIQFSTEVIDTNSAYDHSSNYRFTVPSGQAGKYFFTATIRLATSTDMDDFQVMIKKNGSVASKSAMFHDYHESRECDVMLDLSVGDYIEVFVYVGVQKPTSSATTENRFIGFKVSS